MFWYNTNMMTSPPDPVETQPPLAEWQSLPTEATHTEWTPVPLENLSPGAWQTAVEMGAHTPEEVSAIGGKAIELVIRGGIPLLVKKDADGGFSLPIRRAGSLFSFLHKRDLKKQGLLRLRLDADRKELHLIGNGDEEERVVVDPNIQRKIPMGNASMVPDFAYKKAQPEIKSLFKGKLNFIIFH